MLKTSLLNKIYILEVILFGLIITGFLPRETSIFLAIGLAVYIAIAPIEDATVFFVRSIPLFIAIPITANYDNLNAWRILSIILFLKLAHVTGLRYFLDIRQYSKTNKILLALLLLAVLSIIPAPDKAAAVTRVIYFINLSFIGMVIYYLIGQNKDFAVRLVKNIIIPTIIVVKVGYIQLISTYFIDIYQFMRIWGEGIQMRQFGVLWSEIAVRLGNTWFAYYGPQLSLRVFSLFPDSHSFPQFVLLGIPAFFAVALRPIWKLQIQDWRLRRIVRTRMAMSILLVPAAMLIAILSGTRGIWAASAGVVLMVFFVMFLMYKDKIAENRKNVFKYMALYMIVFFLLFAIAWPIFVSPQFLLAKGDWNILSERIRSIIDFGETSNSHRIEIWQASWESIKHKPLLGVGIGNFPVVLQQNVFLARAGSSAHNIYLHIAAEMGMLALLVTVWFLWIVFRRSYKNFTSVTDPTMMVYFAGTLLFVPWVLIYSLTDVALFDERSFLLFIATIAIILGTKPGSESSRV